MLLLSGLLLRFAGGRGELVRLALLWLLAFLAGLTGWVSLRRLLGSIGHRFSVNGAFRDLFLFLLSLELLLLLLLHLLLHQLLLALLDALHLHLAELHDSLLGLVLLLCQVLKLHLHLVAVAFKLHFLVVGIACLHQLVILVGLGGVTDARLSPRV